MILKQGFNCKIPNLSFKQIRLIDRQTDRQTPFQTSLPASICILRSWDFSLYAHYFSLLQNELVPMGSIILSGNDFN